MGCGSSGAVGPRTKVTHLVRTNKAATLVALGPNNGFLATVDSKKPTEVTIWRLGQSNINGVRLKSITWERGGETGAGSKEGKHRNERITDLAISPDGNYLLLASVLGASLRALPDGNEIYSYSMSENSRKASEMAFPTCCWSQDGSSFALVSPEDVHVLQIEPKLARDDEASSEKNPKSSSSSSPPLSLKGCSWKHGQNYSYRCSVVAQFLHPPSESKQQEAYQASSPSMIAVAGVSGASAWDLKEIHGQNLESGFIKVLSDVPAPVHNIKYKQAELMAIDPTGKSGIFAICDTGAGSWKEKYIFPWKKKAKQIFGHLDVVTACSFTPDGGYVIMGGKDGEVLLLGVRNNIAKFVSARDTTNHRMTLDGGHRSRIRDVSVTWHGIATACDDWSSRVFRLTQLPGAPRLLCVVDAAISDDVDEGVNEGGTTKAGKLNDQTENPD